MVLTARNNTGQMPHEYLAGPDPNEERFRAVFESAPIGMALHVATGKVVETNRAYQAMLGYTNEELVNLGVRRVTHPEDVAEGQRLWKELLAGERDVYVREKRYIHKGGHIVWAQATASAVRHGDGTLRYILSMVRDISAQKRAAREARIFSELGKQLNVATTAREAATIILDVAQELLGWDAAYLHLKSSEGYIDPVLTLDTTDGRIAEVPASRMERKPSPLMQHVLARGAVHVNRGQSGERTSPVPLEPFGEVERPSESMLYAPIRHGAAAVGIISVQRYTANAYAPDSLALLESLAEHCAGALSRIQDTTERKRLEREVLEISALERRRIGHELHDGVGQHLAGVAFKAKLLERQLSDDGSECAAAAGEVARLVNAAIRQVRFVCTGLDPAASGTSNLVSNLAKLANDIEAVYQIQCTFSSNWTALELDANTNLHLYRIAQEAINNSIRHGEARKIQIELLAETEQLDLSIEDNGKGFSTTVRHADGIGLRSMKLRVGACGGAMSLHSQPGEGTVIRCKIPLK